MLFLKRVLVLVVHILIVNWVRITWGLVLVWPNEPKLKTLLRGSRIVDYLCQLLLSKAKLVVADHQRLNNKTKKTKRTVQTHLTSTPHSKRTMVWPKAHHLTAQQLSKTCTRDPWVQEMQFRWLLTYSMCFMPLLLIKEVNARPTAVLGSQALLMICKLSRIKSIRCKRLVSVLSQRKVKGLILHTLSSLKVLLHLHPLHNNFNTSVPLLYKKHNLD